MKTQEQSTLAEQAFEKIFDLILTGALPIGGIVSELSLAQRFAISRGPVREAVRRLQGLGLVTREPYARARVVMLSQKDLVEIFQLRQAVEGMACRLAAANMSDAEIARLADDLEADRARAGGESRFDLHGRIAAGCGNQRIAQLLGVDLEHLLRIYRARSGATPGRREQAHDEHWQIVRALQIRDGDLAESLMRSHIGRATQSLLRATAEAEPAAE